MLQYIVQKNPWVILQIFTTKAVKFACFSWLRPLCATTLTSIQARRLSSRQAYVMVPSLGKSLANRNTRSWLFDATLPKQGLRHDWRRADGGGRGPNPTCRPENQRKVPQIHIILVRDGTDEPTPRWFQYENSDRFLFQLSAPPGDGDVSPHKARALSQAHFLLCSPVAIYAYRAAFGDAMSLRRFAPETHALIAPS